MVLTRHYQSAYPHIFGRNAYEGISGDLPEDTDHPFHDVMNAARKVVFSRTLKTAEWANTTIAAGDTIEEIDKLRQGGDGHIVVWGGVGFWRSLMRLDLIHEFRLDLHPYVAGEATRLFNDDVPKNYRLDRIDRPLPGHHNERASRRLFVRQGRVLSNFYLFDDALLLPAGQRAYSTRRASPPSPRTGSGTPLELSSPNEVPACRRS